MGVAVVAVLSIVAGRAIADTWTPHSRSVTRGMLMIRRGHAPDCASMIRTGSTPNGPCDCKPIYDAEEHVSRLIDENADLRAQVEALTQRAEAAERERDTLKNYVAGMYGEASKIIPAQAAQINALREAFQGQHKYLGHLAGCPIDYPNKPCTCGLDNLERAGIPALTAERDDARVDARRACVFGDKWKDLAAEFQAGAVQSVKQQDQIKTLLEFVKRIADDDCDCPDGHRVGQCISCQAQYLTDAAAAAPGDVKRYRQGRPIVEMDTAAGLATVEATSKDSFEVQQQPTEPDARDRVVEAARRLDGWPRRPYIENGDATAEVNAELQDLHDSRDALHDALAALDATPPEPPDRPAGGAQGVTE